MRIKEIEEKTGITAKNIRFYEKQGLLSPVRESGNKYRSYTEEDRERLMQIKLLRKLGVSLYHMKLLFDRQIKLQDCIDIRKQELEEEKERVGHMLQMCDTLYQSVDRAHAQIEELKAENYLAEIENCERKGRSFINIASDYITWANNILPDPAFHFEPVNPILTKEDFLTEIALYCGGQNLEYEIIHEGMEPIVRVNGKKYLFMLEQPRMIEPSGILRFLSFFFFYTSSYGFKFVYVYAYQ